MNIDLDEQTLEKLQAIAAIKSTSIDALLRDYADEQENYWRERKEDMERLDAMKQGDFISQEDMFTKIDELAKQAENKA